MEQFLRIIKSIEDHFAKENVELIGISKCFRTDETQARKIIESRLETREEHKHVMRKKAIEFYSLGVAASYLLYMRELGYHLEAIQEWVNKKKFVLESWSIKRMKSIKSIISETLE